MKPSLVLWDWNGTLLDDVAFVWTRSTVCSASIITRSNTALPSTVRFWLPD